MYKVGDFVKINKYASLVMDADIDDVYRIEKIDGSAYYLDFNPIFPLTETELTPATEADIEDAPEYVEEEVSVPNYQCTNFAEWIMSVLNERMNELEDDMEEAKKKKLSKWANESIKENYNTAMDAYESAEVMAITIDRYGTTFTTDEIIEAGLVR